MRRVVMMTPEKLVYLYHETGLLGMIMLFAPGVRRNIYTPQVDDFVTHGQPHGTVHVLPTATIICPGGAIKVHNPNLAGPVEWRGSLTQVSNGVVITGPTDYEGIVDSEMRCVSPPLNMRGYADKQFSSKRLKAGESFTFGANVIGFVIVYGTSEQHMQSFSAAEGDVFTATVDTVLAISSAKS